MVSHRRSIDFFRCFDFNKPFGALSTPVQPCIQPVAGKEKESGLVHRFKAQEIKHLLFPIFFLLLLLPTGYAAIVQLKNGNAIETKILKEDEEFLTVEAPGGKVKIPKSDIQTVWRGTKEQLVEVSGKQVFFTKGVELYKQGRFQESAEAFEQAVMPTAANAVIYANLGSAYASSGAAAKAEENFLKALEKDPNNTDVLLNLAHFYEAKQSFPKAIPYYQKVIELKPKELDPKRNLAYCYYRIEKFLDAAKLFEELGQGVDKVSAYNSATAYIQAGQLEKAEAILKPLLTTPIPAAHFNMALIYQWQKRYAEAVKMYYQAMIRDPKNPKILINLGRSYLEMGDLDKAETNFNKALVKNPQDLDAAEGLTQVFMRKKEPAKAVKLFEQLVEGDSSNPILLNRLGLLYLKSNETSKAIDVYKKMLEIDARDAKAHANLGLVYATMNDVKNALKEWNMALALDPDLKAAAQNKKMLEDVMRGDTDAKKV